MTREWKSVLGAKVYKGLCAGGGGGGVGGGGGGG